MKLKKVYFLQFLLIFLISCAVNPVTGKKELMLIPESQEIEMGKSVDRSVKSEYGIYGDRKLNLYINKVGQKLVLHVHRKNLKYYFSVLDSDVVNAFAAPGGYIYITRGLIAMLNSECELATVLGHELGHVNARHSAKAMSRAILFNAGLVVAAGLSKKVRDIAPIISIGTQLLFLKYSRDNEYQADSLGVLYARRAGYNPKGIVNFFYSLENLTKEAGGPHLPNFLSTHPLTKKRIERAISLLEDGDSSLAIRRLSYLKSINGVVYGKDPRQGYVERGYFYHPNMRFYFKIPPGWNVYNTPKQVKLVSKDKNSVIFLMAEKNQNTPSTYAESLYKKFKNTDLVSYGDFRVNGFSAYYIDFFIYNTQNDGSTSKVRALIDTIRKGNYIFTFLAASTPDKYEVRKRAIISTMNSFSNLTNPYYINRKPFRVYISRVNSNQTLRNFLLANSVSKKWWKKVSIINNLSLSKNLKAGDYIKVIR